MLDEFYERKVNIMNYHVRNEVPLVERTSPWDNWRRHPEPPFRFPFPLDTPICYIRECYSLCPRENGTWTEEPGDSTWIPDPDYVPQKQNPEGQTWSEILKEYGIDGIDFINGEPNLDSISKGNVEIDGFTSDRAKNFAKADIALAKERGCTPEEVAQWRKENGYTWHERSDMRTMQKVLSKVHNNIPHAGGVSRAKMEGR